MINLRSNLPRKVFYIHLCGTGYHYLSSKKYQMFSDDVQTLGIALILVRNPETKKYLAVNEKDGSWWLPGGRIDAPELFSVGAIR